MNRVVSADIVVIALNQETKSVGDTIVVHEMIGIQDHDTDAEMKSVGSTTKDPGLRTDAQDPVDDMRTMVFSIPLSKTYRTTV
ncbi:unnamed protein product [Alternaria alternata]|uniref:Uncharacterized protein n=2 Tax=Alternaria alternata complex TaxID=187734 RepID=A0A4Q4NBW1_ALTAL|nr:hypothetical protein AA0115_g4920 [Alternaria tenuissima]RYN73690.1 hypothetical protein AA0117_g7539 [Alternaria alternata]RYN62197.1 hypothetical protein AA0114_g402 [Alternaria tenuissima]RYN86194.1 hypothetical protein AA0120_g8334 [Alternaria tenuissima]RYO07452.1 hypothetical protein AA0119_g2134 [Alternaria tenuissima]